MSEGVPFRQLVEIAVDLSVDHVVLEHAGFIGMDPADGGRKPARCSKEKRLKNLTDVRVHHPQKEMKTSFMNEKSIYAEIMFLSESF